MGLCGGLLADSGFSGVSRGLFLQAKRRRESVPKILPRISELLLAICILVPLWLYRQMEKESLVKRTALFGECFPADIAFGSL